MSTTIPDLWPEKLIRATSVSPASILREQGYKLGEKTQNYVLGKITSNFGSDGKFMHEFSINCDLVTFESPLLSIKHDLSFYPADLVIYENTFSSRVQHKVSDVGDLEQVLRGYFSQPGLADLISSLYAQCLDVDSAN